MPRLILTREGHTQEYELLEQTTLGRSSKNTIRVPEGKASRQHALIEKQDEAYVLRDLDSSNGTYVNNIRVTTQPLKADDTIRIGDSRFVFADHVDDPLVGCRLGNYQIEERLGQGGMGAVYRAKQVTMDRDVALKVMRPKYAEDDNFVEDFMREAHIAGRLHHPNIIAIHDFGQEEGHYFFSMEFVRGETLFDYIKREGRQDPDRVIELLTQIATALAHAHDKDVIHQDVKPENIMITDGGQVKVADLGLAKMMSYGSGTSMVDQKPVMGTPQYVAPEVVRRSPPDPRSDIYSLAATAYYVATGRPPYEGDSSTEIIRQHLAADVPDPRHKRPDLPPPLASFIMRGLAKDPRKRPASCQEILAELGRIREEIRRKRSPSPPRPPQTQGECRRSKTEPLGPVNPWKPVAVVIMYALSLLVAGTVSWIIYRLIRGG